MGIVLTEKYHMDIGRNIRNEGAFCRLHIFELYMLDQAIQGFPFHMNSHHK